MMPIVCSQRYRYALIHPSAWNGDSRKFASNVFRGNYGCLGILKHLLASQFSLSDSSWIHCPMVTWACGETMRDSSCTRGKEDDQCEGNAKPNGAFACQRTRKGGLPMRRALLLAFVGAVLVVAFAGVALAAMITCPATGGVCTGTSQADQITGSTQADEIHALAGDDQVSAGDGDDELNGDQGNDTLLAGQAGN